MKKTYQTPETLATEVRHSNLCAATLVPISGGSGEETYGGNGSKAHSDELWDDEE